MTITQDNLVTINNNLVSEKIGQLKSKFQELLNINQPPGAVDAYKGIEKSHKAVQSILDNKFKNTLTNEEVIQLSYLLDFLSLITQQRTYQTGDNDHNDSMEALAAIETLIGECYQPFVDCVKQNLPISPDQILPVYFRGDYLAQPKDPVPFLIVPNFFEGYKYENWIGVVHEVGHHIYRQVPNLRDEIEVTLANELSTNVIKNATFDLKNLDPIESVTLTAKDDYSYQHRLWFYYLEEIFADLVGVMSLGAAYVYSQQVMIAGSVSPDQLEKLLAAQDLTHPIPYFRGEIGIYMYEKLLSLDDTLDKSDLQTLKTVWNSVWDSMPNDNTSEMQDPHTPVQSSFLKDAWNPDGKLDIIETWGVLFFVIDKLMTKNLRSLGGKSLSDLIKDYFTSDEKDRSDTMKGIPTRWNGIRITVATCWLKAYA